MKLFIAIGLMLLVQNSYAAAKKEIPARNPASYCGSSNLAAALAEADEILASSYKQGSDEERKASELTFCLMSLTQGADMITFKKLMEKVKALNHQYCQAHGASC
ncbi:MAG: hypothetical protein ACXVB9_09175 [Bdellovibrionota bacterium]